MEDKKKNEPDKKDEISPGPGRTLRAATQPARPSSVRDRNAQPPPDSPGNIPEYPDEFNTTDEVMQCESAFLNSILECMDSAVFTLDREYRYTGFNSHHAKMMKQQYGATIERGKSIFDFLTVKEDRDQAKYPIDRALAGEQVTVGIFTGEDARTRRYFEVTHRPVKDTKTTITGVAVFALDITERRRAEEAVRESEERYRRICEGLTDYLYTVHVQDGRAVSTIHGAACVAVTGYMSEEFARDPYLWITMVSDEDRERVISHVNAVLRGEPVPLVEHRIMRKDGQVRWVRDTPILYRDTDGRLVSYDGVIKDITATKLAEEALQESESTYRNLYEYAQVGLFETSLRDGTVIACNERYATLAGFSSVRDALGKDIVHLYADPGDRKEVSWILHEQGRIDDHVVRFKNHQTGHPFWAQFSARINPKKDAAEGTIIDISEQKRIEQELSTKHEELMAAFEQLTATEEELKGQFDVLAGSERNLRINENRLRMAQEIGQIGAWEYSFETGMIWGSAEALRIYGFPPVEGYHPLGEIEACVEDPERIQQAFVDFINGKKEYNIEITVNPRDGASQRVVHSIARLEKGTDNRPLKVVGIFQDITERKRIESELSAKHEELKAAFEELTAAEEELKSQFDALAESELNLRIHENRLRMAQKIGQIGAWEYSFETGMIWGSAEGLRIFGYPAVAGNFPIGDIEACIPERERVHKALVDLIMEGKEYNLEYAINPADGSPKKVIHSIARIDNDALGKPLRVVGVIQDITGRKRAEEEVQHLTLFQKSIIDNALVWLSVLDPAGKILVWNAAAAEISGYRSEEVIGTSAIWKLLYPEKEYRSQVTTTINRIIREKKYLENFETVIRTKDGSEKIISWNTKSIPDTTGKNADYIVIGMDVTARHRAEEQLKNTLDDLRRFNNLTVDRELRMIALKQEINALLKKSGESEKYGIKP